MRPILFLMSLFSITVTNSIAQSNDTKATMALDYLNVDKNGKMIAFPSGHIYKADNFGDDWAFKNVQFQQREYPFIERGVKGYGFFNTDTFLLSGCVYYDSLTPHCGLFRTVNSGLSFQKIILPNVERTGRIFSNEVGQAWLVTSSGIFFSSDYGVTWRQVGNTIRPEVLAAPCFFFKDTLNGIFSGGEWGLFLTNDNCQTIRSLQTPADQKKTGSGAQISAVFFYDDFLIVQSGDNWFYSKSDNINWQPLSTIKELCLDRQNHQLWGFNLHNQVVKLDKQLKINWQSSDIFQLSYPLSMQAINGDFYFTFGQSLYKINEHESKRVLNYQKGKPIEVDIESRDTAQSLVWGWGHSHLYQSKDSSKTWRTVKELPYPFIYSNPHDIPYLENRRFSSVNDSIISIYEFNKMKRVQFNSETKDITPHSIAGLFNDFLKAKITKIALSDRRMGGVVAGPATFIDYKLKKNKKQFKSTYSTGGYGYDLNLWQALITRIKFNHRHFNYSKIDTFLHQLNREPERHLTWADFRVKKADRKKYLNQLKDLKKSGYQSYAYANYEDPLYYPNIDTPFLKSIALQNEFSDSLLTDIFCSEIAGHGVRNYLKMIIENENGETIEISDDYIHSSPKYLIWVIKYKNWEFRTANINIFKFMASLSPQSFWHYGNRPRWQIYLEIAEYLYPKRDLKD